MRPRVIPILLIENDGLVKSIKFKNKTYIGDPINAIRLFNNMSVDEIIILDISRTRAKLEPNYDLIHDIASEAFFPVCYGGGVSCVKQMARLFALGIEKISLNSQFRANPQIIIDAIKEFGSQAIVISLDYTKNLLGKLVVFDHVHGKSSSQSLFDAVESASMLNPGELMLTSVDRDGTFNGYDIDTLKSLCSSLNMPVIANGGAGTVSDFSKAINAGASAVAAGSLFVYASKKRGVLINYPDQQHLERLFPEK